MTDTRTSISEVGTIFVPVSDQDRALEFYVDKLGFEKRAEFEYGERHRWIEVGPPGATSTPSTRPCAPGRSTSMRRSGAPAPPVPGLISTGVLVESPLPPQFFFRDPDGNRFLIVQVD